MNDINDSQEQDNDIDTYTQAEPCDDFPGTFFRIPSPPGLHDTWSLN